MIHLPKNLPQEINNVLSLELEEEALEEAFPGIARSVKDLFHAQHVVLYCSTDRCQGRMSVEKQRCIENDEYFLINSNAFGNDFQSMMGVDDWKNSGIHQHISRDLRRKSNCLSFSAFSWPYPSCLLKLPALNEYEAADDSRKFEIVLPADYCVLLPFSSELVARHSEETEFFGYLVLLFDSFPVLSESIVQLIVTFPGLLSEITAGYLRGNAALKAAYLSSYAHDLKRHILASCEFAKMIKGREEGQAEIALDSLERSLVRMIHLSNQLLLFDKCSHGTLKLSQIELDLNELVAEAARGIEGLYAAANLQLDVELEEELPKVVADPAIFPSVIENLLENALKYSFEGGQVKVKTFSVADEKVCLEVTDYGLQISGSEEDKVFDLRFRGSNAGTIAGNGLGLYLVKKVIELHDGKVVLRNNYQEGKSFVVSLPVSKGNS